MLLPIEVTFRNIKDSGKLETLVKKEAAKLEQFYDRITSCRVVVERPQRAQSGKLYHVRIDLRLPNAELVVRHLPSLHGTLQDIQAERSRKEAESVLARKSPQRAVRQAFHEMRRQLQDYGREQEGFVKTISRLPEAEVTQIFSNEGYGFLRTTDNRQLYFHETSVLDGHFNRLRVGTRVRFAEEMGEKGPQASTVKIIHPRRQARTAAAVEPFPRKVAATHVKL